MPTLKDLYNELLSKDKTKDLALMIEKFAVGSLSTLGGSTNVDLDNKYIVIDISEMNEHLKHWECLLLWILCGIRQKKLHSEKGNLYGRVVETYRYGGKQTGGRLCLGDI